MGKTTNVEKATVVENTVKNAAENYLLLKL